MIIQPFAFIASQAAAPAGLLLDDYPGAIVAHSVRKLRTAYTGFCLKVRRSSDNATQDIGFVGNDLDTASLLSFVGGSSGYIEWWYNQADLAGAKNLKMLTLAKQPIIVSSGVLTTSRGLPSLQFATSKTMEWEATYPTLGTSYSYYTLITRAPGTNTYLFGGSGPGSRPSIISGYSGNDFEYFDSSRIVMSATGASTTEVSQLSFTTTLGTNATGHYQGTEVFNQSVPFSADLRNLEAVGGSSTFQDYSNAYYSEFIVYNSNEAGNTSGIIANQNTYYTLY